MSLSTAAVTRCSTETVFLWDETDVQGHGKGTRSAQDVYTSVQKKTELFKERANQHRGRATATERT